MVVTFFTRTTTSIYCVLPKSLSVPHIGGINSFLNSVVNNYLFHYSLFIKETVILKEKLKAIQGNANGLMFRMMILIGQLIQEKHHRRELGHLPITHSQKVKYWYVGVIFLNWCYILSGILSGIPHHPSFRSRFAKAFERRQIHFHRKFYSTITGTWSYASC